MNTGEVSGKFDDIQGFKDSIDRVQRSILEQFGWKETCDTPGSYWLWEKQMDDGRVLLVPQSMALSFVEYEIAMQLECDSEQDSAME